MSSSTSKLGPSFWIIAFCAIMGLLLQIQWLFASMVVLALLLLFWENSQQTHGAHSHGGHETAKSTSAPAQGGGAGFMDVFIGNLMADKHRELNPPKAAGKKGDEHH